MHQPHELLVSSIHYQRQTIPFVRLKGGSDQKGEFAHFINILIYVTPTLSSESKDLPTLGIRRAQFFPKYYFSLIFFFQ